MNFTRYVKDGDFSSLKIRACQLWVHTAKAHASAIGYGDSYSSLNWYFVKKFLFLEQELNMHVGAFEDNRIFYIYR